MIKCLLAATVVASAAFGTIAQNYDTMYLIKGDHVVGKYKVDDVDYASFTLPDGVSDDNISAKVDRVGKNSVSYTISTVNPSITYAHNILSSYDLDYMALDFEGDYFANLDEATKLTIMQTALSYNAYLGRDTKSYTHTDYALDGSGENSRFSVRPGTHYYLCAWEVDPVEYSPMETFVFTEFDTEKPAQGTATIDVKFRELIEQGVVLDFTGTGVYYVSTCWGPQSTMDPYVEALGLDYLLGFFGQDWSLDFLQDTGDLAPGVPNSLWPLNGSGKYVMYVRAYDINGDITDLRVPIEVEEGGTGAEAPVITIFSKSKGTGKVNVNFEISPSNVEEAYVRLMGENMCDDRLNMGYELYELAMGGDAIDITSEINTTGEYTYNNNEVEEEWKSLLIYAKGKDGGRTTLRINFWPDDETEWAINKPVYNVPARKMPAVKNIRSKRNPSLRKL